MFYRTKNQGEKTRFGFTFTDKANLKDYGNGPLRIWSQTLFFPIPIPFKTTRYYVQWDTMLHCWYWQSVRIVMTIIWYGFRVEIMIAPIPVKVPQWNDYFPENSNVR